MHIANKRIQTLVQIFEERRTIPGSYYENSRKAVDNLCFQGVSLHKAESENDPAIHPASFYKNLKTSMDKRLLNNDDVEFANLVRVLEIIGLRTSGGPPVSAAQLQHRLKI
jgi:hypothetical protein